MTIDHHLQERLDTLLMLVKAGKPLKEALPKTQLSHAWYTGKIPKELKAVVIRAKREWEATQRLSKGKTNEFLFLKTTKQRKQNIKAICKAKNISVTRAINSLLAGYEDANRHLLESPT